MENKINSPLICLTLTGKTLQENVDTYRQYKNYVDIVELRADFLQENEQFYVRKFPPMIGIPCILTVRRVQDGGQYKGNEFSRTTLFSRALAFAEQDPIKNFSYVDFEEDYNIASLNDIALAFSVRIIRSCHDFTAPVFNLKERFRAMQKTRNEIFKIASTPKTLHDVTRLFEEAKGVKDIEHIICCMGAIGTISRILSYQLGSLLTYSSPVEMNESMKNIGHIDPIALKEMYNFKNINDKTSIYAVTGFPLKSTSSPLLHNTLYHKYNMNNLFIPLPSTSIAETLEFAEEVGVKGIAITVPYKEKIISEIDSVDAVVGEIGACNTIVKEGNKWEGHNTDALGFQKALTEFLGVDKLKGRKVAIIGAGGAARAVTYIVKKLGGRACIFNRTLEKAMTLARKYNYKAASLSPSSLPLLEKYSDIIIQTTNVGLYSKGSPSPENNPLWFYKFCGKERVFDIIYTPEVTSLMKVAAEAGCKVCNGYSMLKYQGFEQFKYFTGKEVK